MILQSDHPRYVAYNQAGQDYYVNTILSACGRYFKTRVIRNNDRQLVDYFATECRQKAIDKHMILLDKYTFYHWTH